jgi:hypothetical protein
MRQELRYCTAPTPEVPRDPGAPSLHPACMAAAGLVDHQLLTSV